VADALFYYPYAEPLKRHRELFRMVALYFDKLCLLDPEKANGGAIGAGEMASEASLLEGEGLLERLQPAEMIRDYGSVIADGVRRDLADSLYLNLCEREGGDRPQAWTVAIEKVPAELRQDPRYQPLDRATQSFMGKTVPEVVREVGTEAERYQEAGVTGFVSAVEGSGALQHVYDETRGEPGDTREYRYVDYPLPLGESIMLNHALAGSALHADAAPVTDDRFHHEMLQYKLGQARGAVADALHERARRRGFAHAVAASQALVDPELDLPAFSPDVPLEAVLDYRMEHSDELDEVRRLLSRMSQRLRGDPWTPEFAEEIEHDLLPELGEALDEARAKRDAWARRGRGKRMLDGVGLGAGAASTGLALALAPTPLLPVSIGLAALGFGANAAGLRNDYVEGRAEAESGLTYLIRPIGS
jgi:hypothetical protein